MNPKIGISLVVVLILSFPFLVTFLSSEQQGPKEVAWEQRQTSRGSISHEEEMRLSPMGDPAAIGQAPRSQGPSGSHLPIMRWEVMQGLDYRNGSMSDELKETLKTPVRIPGFVVPLDYSSREAKEFILVPTYGACIHVPPPPPNQMIYVKMRNGVAPRREHGPVWVHGRTEIMDSETEWGTVSYMLHADGTEPYQGGY